MMDAKKKAVIRAAKAVGAPRVKGARGTSALLQKAKGLQRTALTLSAKGAGQSVPASQVYSPQDFTGLNNVLSAMDSATRKIMADPQKLGVVITRIRSAKQTLSELIDAASPSSRETAKWVSGVLGRQLAPMDLESLITAINSL